MRELYDITLTEAIAEAVQRLEEEHPELSKTQAKKLITNTLVYNCVIDEIVGQAEFLLGEEGQEI